MDQYEVIIVGGSYAGLSAAMALGRSLKQTLVIDSGKPCNRQTPHSHNFLTRDGQTPKQISTLARQQVEKYESITFHDGVASTGEKVESSFEISTQTKDTFYGEKLILATGIKDQIPDVPGFSECWGVSVIHCPYCHGYEYRDQKTGIWANGEKAFHSASLVNNLTDKLVIITNRKANFTPEQINTLEKHNIHIEETEVIEIEHQNGYLDHVILKDENKIELDAMYVSVPFTQHSNIPVSLGCKLTEQGYIDVDDFQKTTVPGIFACGDNSSEMRSIANAVSTGNLAGGMANMELTDEKF
jgi:thioredoxin reductase